MEITFRKLAQLLHTKLACTKYPISSGTDRRTDSQTNGQTDGQAQPYVPSFSRGITIYFLTTIVISLIKSKLW